MQSARRRFAADQKHEWELSKVYAVCSRQRIMKFATKRKAKRKNARPVVPRTQNLDLNWVRFYTWAGTPEEKQLNAAISSVLSSDWRRSRVLCNGLLAPAAFCQSTSPGQLSMPTLFGGAIELELPERFEDISSYRDVPDNQEVGAWSSELDAALRGWLSSLRRASAATGTCVLGRRCRSLSPRKSLKYSA